MVTLIVILSLIAGGYTLGRATKFHRHRVGSGLMMAAGLILLAVYTVSFSMVRFVIVPEQIEGFRATRQTIERARDGGSQLENAALQQKVVEQNQWLAKQKWWGDTDIGFWIPPEVDSLEPIE